MYCKIKKIPYFSKYFSTVSLTIVTRKLKLHSMCSQNKMFKHPKLKTMTQLSNKHSCRTQFFFSPQLLCLNTENYYLNSHVGSKLIGLTLLGQVMSLFVILSTQLEAF